MKIGFDAKRLFNNFTGLGNHSRTTLDILTTEFPEHEYYLYTPSSCQNTVTDPYLSNQHFRIMLPRQKWQPGFLWRSYGMVKDLKRDGIDLFHGLSNEIPIGLTGCSIQSVVTIHDVAFHTFPDMYRWHDRWIYHQKWKYACRHADKIIAISNSTKRDIMRFYNIDDKKIHVVYQPVNKVYYETDSPHEPSDFHEPYMLYVGSVNSRKNLLGIVKAMEQLPKDLQMPLVIVGNGSDYKRQVEQYIEQHGMKSLFRWTKVIESKQLKQLYSHASLFLYPSFYEGFGLPVVEALLSGCPVITSNVSSLPEAGGPYALQVNPNDVDSIRDSIVKVLTDSSLRHQMIEGGRQYALQTFHPKVLAHRLMDVYTR